MTKFSSSIRTAYKISFDGIMAFLSFLGNALDTMAIIWLSARRHPILTPVAPAPAPSPRPDINIPIPLPFPFNVIVGPIIQPIINDIIGRVIEDLFKADGTFKNLDNETKSELMAELPVALQKSFKAVPDQDLRTIIYSWAQAYDPEQEQKK